MVDFVEHDISQSGVDARIGPRDSVVQSVLEAVQSTSIAASTSGGSVRGWPDPSTAPPLYEYINPDALEALYTHARDHRGTSEWTTTFEYAGNTVSVTSAGTVTVESRDGDDTDQREHGCPDCDEGTVSMNDDKFLVGATLQCPECGHEWDVSF